MLTFYYSPAACSLAVHVMLHELGLSFEAIRADAQTGNTGALKAINPKGHVPVLVLENGEAITEVAVILQYLADHFSHVQLLPALGTLERYRALEWLNFIATEVHHGFSPFWLPNLPAFLHEATCQKLAVRYDWIEAHLQTHSVMLGTDFSIVDIYLFAVTRWFRDICEAQAIDMKRWPALQVWLTRLEARPAVQVTLQAEGLKR